MTWLVIGTSGALAQEAPAGTSPQGPPLQAEKNAKAAVDARFADAPDTKEVRQEKAEAENRAIEAANPEKNDIVVVGIRGSIQTANKMKRDAKQISDSVVAEDAGKLPDNNVPEALARVTGVQIDRSHGEGSSVTIRGLSDVQTTVNGQDLGQAGSRSLDLSDIPADLIKSVTVYKTRSADQVEGGIAGTVNVELRRPLDLKKGWTLAGSFRETFSDIGNTKSPYASLLLAKHIETGIGDMGFLVNASYSRNNYFENYVVSESPQQVPVGDPNSTPPYTPAYRSLSASIRDTLIIPYAVNYGVEHGSIKRPDISASYQWRPSPQLDFVLEGEWIGSKSVDYTEHLRLVTNDGNQVYSNVVANSEGTIRSMNIGLQPYSGTGAPPELGGGPDTYSSHSTTNTYNTNFEAHWHGGIAQLNFRVGYNWSRYDQYYADTNTRFAGATTATVDFNSPNVPGGGAYITFPGVDITNPATSGLSQIHDQVADNYSHQFVSNVDLTLNTSATGFLRSLQLGVRFTDGDQGYDYGYRDAFFFDSRTRPTLAQVSAATGIGLTTTSPNLRGAAQNVSWVHLDDAAQYAAFDTLRRYVIAQPGVDLGGNDWSTVRPTYNDLGSAFYEKERTFAAYGIVNYGLKLHFPIDGQFGLRFVNTWGTAASTQNAYATVNGKLPKDADGNTIYTFTQTPTSAKGNYVDLLPSATGIIHMSPKLQLRLSYTHNISRPDFYSLRSFIEIRDALASPTGPVYEGNPDLKPVQENNFDASLEWNFGRAGLLSFAPFLKKQTGFIYTTRLEEYVPQVSRVALVEKPRNAGPGTIAGFETAFNTFFDFLPGKLKNFGIQTNFTFIPKAELHLDYADTAQGTAHLYDAPYTSRYSGNAILLYDTPVFSARLAYNYRSRYKTGIDYVNPGYSIFSQETSRLDAAVNYTPFKFITLSVEATNLLHNDEHNYYGAYQALPVGVRQQARIIIAGARFRF